MSINFAFIIPDLSSICRGPGTNIICAGQRRPGDIRVQTYLQIYRVAPGSKLGSWWTHKKVGQFSFPASEVFMLEAIRVHICERFAFLAGLHSLMACSGS